MVEVAVGEDTIKAKVWSCKVGHKENVTLYLLDSDIEENSEKYRKLTSQLYCGDRRERFLQELLLGIGGWRALRALDVNVGCLHLNEGHSVFSAIEWARETMLEDNVDFKSAVSKIKSKILFTLHTPVMAGNEEFDIDLANELLVPVARDLKIELSELIELGKYPNTNGFGLSVVALKMANYANGVSKIHGEVSRDMWKDLWPGKDVKDIPIGSVTNGVHYGSWMSPE